MLDIYSCITEELSAHIPIYRRIWAFIPVLLRGCIFSCILVFLYIILYFACYRDIVYIT